MARAKMLSTMAVATFLGVALGVHLGRSAIGAVDPFYFSDPEGGSYAELVPAASLSRPGGGTELASDGPETYECVGCDAHEILYERRYDAGIEEAWFAPEPSPAVETVFEAESVADVEIARAVPTLDVERRQIERYAYYPVSDEAAAAHKAAVSTTVEEQVMMPAEPLPVKTAMVPSY